MCHDINPLGTAMHLRELDRWAARTQGPMVPDAGRLGPVTLRIMLAAWERCRAAVGNVARPASTDLSS